MLNKFMGLKKEKDESGTLRWFNKKGQLHNFGNEPSVVYSNGAKEYHQNGVLHNDNGPAVEYGDGKAWLKNGKLHRDGDLPAVELTDGTKKYYKNGILNRADNQPAVIGADGTLEYYKDGKLHNEANLPAVIHSDGAKEYWSEGEFVSVTPPSVESGEEFVSDSWYTYGKVRTHAQGVIENTNDIFRELPLGDAPALLDDEAYADFANTWYEKEETSAQRPRQKM